jgi:hypothetical protein
MSYSKRINRSKMDLDTTQSLYECDRSVPHDKLKVERSDLFTVKL